MKHLVVLPSFEHSARKLATIEKNRLAESLEQFNAFVLTGDMPVV